MYDVYVVDDDQDQLERLRIVIGSEDDFNLVGASTSSMEALGRIKIAKPDIVLTDILMPRAEAGLDLIQAIHESYPEINIVALSVLEDPPTIVSAIKRGARGYLLKSDPAGKICESLRDVISGGSPLSKKVARHLVEQFQDNIEGTVISLTEREREIFRDAELGYGYRHTAKRMGISVHTIHKQVQKIFLKLKVKNKTEALGQARKKGLF